MIVIEKIFRANLKTVRLERGLSQTALAQRTGLLSSAISHFETGRRSPSLPNILKLAEGLDVSIDRLFGHRSYKSAPDVFA